MLDTTRSLDGLDRIGEGIFTLDADGRFGYLNRAAQLWLPRLVGASAAVDLHGMVIWNASASFAETPTGLALRRAQAEGCPVVHVVRDPATRRMLELRAYPSADGLSVLLLEAAPPRAAEVLDGVSDLFLACDDEWRLTLANARALEYFRLLGQTRGDPIGRLVWEVVPGLIRSRFQAEAFRALVEHSEVEFEAFFAPLKRWFLVRITPTGHGTITCARDVTGWRRTRRALTRETRRLAAVIETQQAVATAGVDQGEIMRAVADRLQALTRSEGVAVFVPDGDNMVLCEGSAAVRALRGLCIPRSQGLLGQCRITGEAVRCDDAATDPHADDHLVAALQLRSALMVPLPGQAGMQAVLATWSSRACAFGALHEHTLRLTAGLLSGAMERAKDFAATQLLLRERTEALAAIRAAEERFRTLVESIDDVVFRLDREQRCVDLFGRWLQREGFRREQLLGLTTRQIVGDAGAPVHERANLRALAGETVTYEWMLSLRRGVRHMQTTLSPLREPGGAVTGIVGVGRDITQRIEAERQVRQAQKMEAVGRFAGGVAHDLNNMMMIIMGFGDFLLASLEPGDARRGDAEEIRKAADRAMHLTRQLLSLGRDRVVARQVLDLNRVVTGMENMLRPLLGEDIVLATELSPDLGAVEADYGQLEQVVMNLALNARDAMDGGGRLTIGTGNVEFLPGQGCEQMGTDIPAGSYVKLAVRDTGHGMRPEVKAHLFEPFFTTKPTTHNTGLGLTIVYGIVAQSGGYIWVDSAPGEGTTFTICFPRVEPEDQVAGDHPGQEVVRRGCEAILLVEDEQVVRTLAARVLSAQGYRVIEASNGQEALTLVERASAPVDLLLTDMVMPVMGGAELVERLKGLRPDLRIVYMSGYSEGDKIRPGVRDPRHPFLQKPFSPESLLQRVRETLDQANR